MGLQDQINATPSGGTLILPDGSEYLGNFIIDKPITLQGKAKIISENAYPAISIAPRVRGVTFLDSLMTSNAPRVYSIVNLSSVPDVDPAIKTVDDLCGDVTFERCQIFGNPGQEVQRGISANGVNVKIHNSRIFECHGKGYDAQAVCAWNGPGPFEFLDSYFEGSGENIMFGGALATIPNLIASDITIKRCQFFKPLAWKGVWTNKNLFELKNAKNVLIDGCTFENSWTDAQIGYAIVITVRGEGVNQMPWATIQNVSIINSVIKNADQGIQTLGIDYSNASTKASGLKVINNQFQGIKSWFFVLNGFDDTTIEHNTHEQGGNVVVFTGPQSQRFIYRNNATYRNPNGYGFKADGGGEGTSALDQYCPGWTFEGNVVAGADSNYYPPNNFYPTDLSGLTNYKGTDGLVPGYTGGITPTPAPSPTPTPTPPATRKVAWPTTEAKQNTVADAQWVERYRWKRNLSGPYAEFEYVPK